MAEFVQQSIEQMLPELEEMVRINLFTQHETRGILKQRKSHEYRMRRRTKEKEDFLKYVQYEINVLALVRKRRDKHDIQHKKVEIDLAIVQRIHSLFRMACHLFQDDVNLWLSHLEFAKKRGEKSTASRLMLRMLQVHTRKPELWTMAAQWEFEMNKSTDNARTLFQRGLRFNAESRLLWLEYYRMELLNVDKLKKRRQILGVEEMETDEGFEETIKQTDAVLEGKIAELVFKKALDAFPEDSEFCLSFVPVCSLFDFSKPLLEGMMEILKVRFGKREEYWSMLASREGGMFIKEKKYGLQAVFELESRKAILLHQACDELKTEKMWTILIKFWLNRAGKKSSTELREKRLEKCLQACEEAEELELLSLEMKMERIKLLSSTPEHQADVKRLCKEATDQHSDSVQLWSLRLRNLIESRQQVDSIVDIFKRALLKFGDQDCCLELWETVVEWLTEKKSRHLLPLFELGLKTKAKPVVLFCKSRYLQYTAANESLKSARKLFAKLAEYPPISKDFMEEYIQLELSESKPKVGLIRKAYDQCLDHFGKDDVDIWLKYIQFEKERQSLTNSVEDSVRVSEVHWKALRTLEPKSTEEFVQKFTLMSPD